MKRFDVLVCKKCGLVMEVVVPCGEKCGIPVCCGEPMTLAEAKTADHTTEKHVPIPGEAEEHGCRVLVGSVPHPMLPEHYVQWIDVINGDYLNRKYLKPGEAPSAEFFVDLKPGMVLREYCNIHGLWQNHIV